MQKTLTRTKRMMTGVILGGFIGYTLSLTSETMLLTIPGVRQFIAVLPFTSAVSLTAAGMIVGGVVGALVPQKDPQFSRTDQRGDAKITLREEQLDIEKEKVKTVDVDIHKEVVTDEKNVTVPVSREELVVEKAEDDHGKEEETMRIPLREERIDVDKDSVPLNDVSVHKEESKDKETVEETLKKEKLATDTEGDAQVKDQEDNT
jgi:uncharacterized protein (TIGR02271 family)